MSEETKKRRRAGQRLLFPARLLLVVVLIVDAAAAGLLMSGALTGGPSVRAQSPDGGVDGADGEAAAAVDEVYTAEALRALGQELAARRAQLQQRELELEEALRGGEVLRRAGLLDAAAEQASAEPPQEKSDEDRRGRESFARLQKAYENMEPESAALALEKLAGRDKEAVVQLLLGWQPRISGAILDALTQTNPTLAADLSYEIWKLNRSS